MALITLDDIRAAAGRIAGAVERTPLLHSRTLSRRTGAEVWLKFENLQFTASFKERGALNRLLALTAEERGRGVIAMSAGNHAQGVAYHAARLGVRAVIVMPRGTPNSKIQGTQVHGAEVVIAGETLAEASTHARELQARERLSFVHPYDDPLVIAGQGTVALEMLEQQPALDALIVPVGGGGLISGMAIAAKAIRPAIRIYGVESKLWCAMHQRLAGEPCERQRLDVLDARMAAAGMDREHYGWYRDLRRYGTVPHAGFGLGFERTLAYATGLSNVRDAIPYPRTSGSVKY